MNLFTNGELKKLGENLRKERWLYVKLSVLLILGEKLGKKNKKLANAVDNCFAEYLWVRENLRELMDCHQ